MKAVQVPLSEVLQQRHGIRVDPTSRYPIAGVFGFGRGIILRESLLGDETKYQTLTPLSVGDVVYSKVKAFEGAVTVVPPVGSGRFVSPEFPVFSVADSVDPDYLSPPLSLGGISRSAARKFERNWREKGTRSSNRLPGH